MSFPSEIPHFWGSENPTDFMLSKQVWECIGLNLNILIRRNNSTVLLLLAACFICFIVVVYKQASCIFMIFEILSDQFYWKVQSTDSVESRKQVC